MRRESSQCRQGTSVPAFHPLRISRGKAGGDPAPQQFTIPTNTFDLLVNLYADDAHDTYFDDIRIHPFNASMKSYVYDGETFWLVSELDDNNYATFHEYDQEGGLIRIKKETSRGVVTIQETRSNTVKSNP